MAKQPPHSAAKLLPLFTILLAMVAIPVIAQITVNYTFTAGTVIDPDQVNSNFNTLGNNALNRTGGTITGNISVNSNVSIDGVDISDYLAGGNITATGNASVGGDLTVTGGANVGADLLVGGAATVTSNASVGGNLGVAGSSFTTGAALFGNSVGITGQITAPFPVISLRGVAYTMPAALGGNGTHLIDIGSGTLGWGWSSGVQGQSSTFTAALGIDFYAVTATATVNLPGCNAASSGKWVHIKNVGTGTVTLDGNTTETIDGQLTYPFSVQWASISIVCGGAGAWYIF